jgi:hypothetical protein
MRPGVCVCVIANRCPRVAVVVVDACVCVCVVQPSQ